MMYYTVLWPDYVDLEVDQYQYLYSGRTPNCYPVNRIIMYTKIDGMKNI